MRQPPRQALAIAVVGGETRGRDTDFAVRSGSARNSSANRSGFEKPSRPDSRSVPPMKTMTCKQLGGPCDVEHHGKDRNEVIKAQDRHLKAQVAAGDEAHREAHEAMRGRWKRPDPARSPPSKTTDHPT
jgi:predicted small metal-binding protein